MHRLAIKGHVLSGQLVRMGRLGLRRCDVDPITANSIIIETLLL